MSHGYGSFEEEQSREAVENDKRGHGLADFHKVVGKPLLRRSEWNNGSSEAVSKDVIEVGEGSRDTGRKEKNWREQEERQLFRGTCQNLNFKQ